MKSKVPLSRSIIDMWVVDEKQTKIIFGSEGEMLNELGYKKRFVHFWQSLQ